MKELLDSIVCPDCGEKIYFTRKDGEHRLQFSCPGCGVVVEYQSPYIDESNIMVSHPPHYQSETGLEAIDVIKAFTANLQGVEATHTGNILKYMCRWKKKNGLIDLEKAKWYLEDLISHVKSLEKENK